MDDIERRGHDIISAAVARVGSPVVLVEMLRQFGDVLHSTIVVRHIRKSEPNVKVVWAIMEPYADSFSPFMASALGPHEIAALPVTEPHPFDRDYRKAWVHRAKLLDGVIRAFGCGVGTWGWKCGSIVDAVLHNAGVGELAVARRPWLPLNESDSLYGNEFINEHGLAAGFVTVELAGYSVEIKELTRSWFDELVDAIEMPVVALGLTRDARLPRGAVDGRDITFRQSKALIQMSKCFIGRGSGLSVVAATTGCEQPVVEVVGDSISMVGIGYRKAGDRHVHVSPTNAVAVADRVNVLARHP